MRIEIGNIESSVDHKIEKAEFKDTPIRNDVYKKTKRNISEILKCTNATPIRCRGGIGYMCCFCKEQYPDPADLKKHTLEHYSDMEVFSNKILKNIMGIDQYRLCIKLDITALTCNLCATSIDSLEDLFNHLIEAHDRIIHKNIKNHIVPFKFETEDITCCICSKTFNSFKALLEHMNTHSKNFVCNICCATFVNKAKISGHELTHVISEFKCSYCPKVLNTKMKKACHESSAHKNVNKISKCGYCNEKFSSHRRKEMHLFEMHGIPLPKIERVTCKICIREFLNKDSLNRHLRRVHLLEKSHKCNIESSVDHKIEKAEFKDTPTRNDVYKKTKRNISEILKCTNATPIRCRGGIGYMCCFCKEQYPDPADLKIHTLEHYSDIEVFSNKILKTIMGIAEHRLCIKLDITALTCNLCDTSIDSLEDLFNHLIEEHDRIIHKDIKNHIVPFKFETEDISCCICSKIFNSFKALLEHMNTHSKNFVCNICCATFVNKAKISVHELTHVISEFKCSYCPKVLDTKLKKACHESNAHKNVNKISKCGYCNEKFSSHKRKEMHLFEMHGIPLPKIERVTCKICIREFLNKNALNAHLRRIHLLEKSHKCEYCEKEFFALNELNNHLVKHTGGRNFQCHLCLRTYKRKKTLTAHMHTHADEVRFKCDLCDLTYLQKTTWRTHMRTKHEIEV
ncbi:unnamed protein product [Colias eurytheme]|nr:unnamed protein product [Colias eurytheme]